MDHDEMRAAMQRATQATNETSNPNYKSVNVTMSADWLQISRDSMKAIITGSHETERKNQELLAIAKALVEALYARGCDASTVDALKAWEQMNRDAPRPRTPRMTIVTTERVIKYAE